MKNQLSRETYRLLMDKGPICTVDVLFFNQKKTETLLFRRVNEPVKGVYFSIGGRLLKNEKLIDGAVRQALKETGIKIKKEVLVYGGVHEDIFKNSVFAGVSYHAINIFYGYILNGKEKIQLDRLHDDYQWFSVNDREIHRFVRNRVTNLLEKL